MPFKHNAARRHHIPTARYRVRNWREYEAGLTRRGDLTLWLDEAAMAGWQAPRRTTPGGQAWYSDAAIELVLTLRLVFHLALRQAEGFTASVLRLLGQELRVPDHTTLSRRSRGFARRRPKAIPHGPMHLVIDSTGLKLFGRGEWDEEEHGRARRSWRKLHLAVDANTGEIVACVLTDNGADDAGEVPALLGQVEGEIASVTADGAYDGEPVYHAATSRQPDRPPDVVIPPRSSAVASTVLSALAPNLTTRGAGRVPLTPLQEWRARWSHDGGEAGDGGWRGHTGCGGCGGGGSGGVRHSLDRSAPLKRSS
jgi:hypothetical protein